MRIAQFPDGDVLFLTAGMLFAVGSTTLTVTYLGTTVKTYVAASSAGAQALQQQLVAVPDNDQVTLLVDKTVTLLWGNITPNTAVVGDSPIYTVNGSGFVAISHGWPPRVWLKFDDGAGNSILAGNGATTSDTSLTVNQATAFAVAGTYTLYYSSDSGSTWNSTGLTVVVS